MKPTFHPRDRIAINCFGRLKYTTGIHRKINSLIWVEIQFQLFKSCWNSYCIIILCCVRQQQPGLSTNARVSFTTIARWKSHCFTVMQLVCSWDPETIVLNTVKTFGIFSNGAWFGKSAKLWVWKGLLFCAVWAVHLSLFCSRMCNLKRGISKSNTVRSMIRWIWE